MSSSTLCDGSTSSLCGLCGYCLDVKRWIAIHAPKLDLVIPEQAPKRKQKSIPPEKPN